jgi:hypothetical protein
MNDDARKRSFEFLLRCLGTHGVKLYRCLRGEGEQEKLICYSLEESPDTAYVAGGGFDAVELVTRYDDSLENFAIEAHFFRDGRGALLCLAGAGDAWGFGGSETLVSDTRVGAVLLCTNSAKVAEFDGRVAVKVYDHDALQAAARR